MKTLEEIKTFSCAECGNKTEHWADTNPAEALCEICDCSELVPATVEIYSARFGGHAVAACSECSFKSVYWDCNHDLIHNCDNY
jgi:hypothetical protein